MSSGKAPQRNLYSEITGELKARSDAMPGVFASESEFRPQFSALELSNLEGVLHGTAGGQRTLKYNEPVQGWRNTVTGEFTTDQARTRPSGFQRGGADTGQWVPWTQQESRTRTVTTPPSTGLMALERSTNPANAALHDKLTSTASSEFDMGAQLDPGLLRLAQQTIRQRNRGSLGETGTAGNYREALGVSAFANQLRQQRRANATEIAGVNQGRTDAMLNRAQGISRAGPNLFGPNVNANDVFSSNQNAAAANSASKAAMNNALAGAGISAAAGVLGALI